MSVLYEVFLACLLALSSGGEKDGKMFGKNCGNKLINNSNAPVNIIPCPPRPGTSGALAGDSQHFVSTIGESGH